MRRQLEALSLGLLLACSGGLRAEDIELQQAERWFYGDVEEQALAVSEGELRFISPAPDQSILHSDSILTISRQSLDDGWVKLQQCYHNLDPVPHTTIAYRYQAINSLQLVSASNIGTVELAPQSVELVNVAADASLCVTANVRLLESLDSGYRLRNGPYHRQFLDGYYPFHVSLSLVYPGEILRAESITPQRQPGFEVSRNDGSLRIDSWFEGKLFVEVQFGPVDKNPGQ